MQTFINDLKKIDFKVYLLLIVFSIIFYYLSLKSEIMAGDGIIHLTYFQRTNIGGNYRTPYYAMLLNFLNIFFSDKELLGKLISSFAGIITVIPIYLCALLLFDKRSAFYSSLFWLLTPLLYFLGPNVNDRLLPLPLTILSWYFFIKYYLEKNNNYLSISIILALLITAVRPSTYVILPIYLYYTYKEFYQKNDGYKKVIFAWSFIVLTLLTKIITGGGGLPIADIYNEWFKPLLPYKFWILFYNNFEMNLVSTPYHFTYPLFFVFVCYLIFLKEKIDANLKFALKFFGLIFLIFWLFRTFWIVFCDWYFIEVIPFFIIFIGKMFVDFEKLVLPKFEHFDFIRKILIFCFKKKLLFFIAFLNAAIYCFLVAKYMTNTFVGLKRCAEFVKQNIDLKTINQIHCSDAFHISPYLSTLEFDINKVQENDLVILMDYGLALGKWGFKIQGAIEELKNKFEIEELYVGRYESKNFFTNISMKPYRYNFHTEWFPNKYKSQFFNYIVLKVVKKKI